MWRKRSNTGVWTGSCIESRAAFSSFIDRGRASHAGWKPALRQKESGLSCHLVCEGEALSVFWATDGVSGKHWGTLAAPIGVCRWFKFDRVVCQSYIATPLDSIDTRVIPFEEIAASPSHPLRGLLGSSQ